MFPKFIVRYVNSISAKVPLRHRGLVRVGLIVAAVLFVAFELSRVWLVSRDYILPIWRDQLHVGLAYVDEGDWVALSSSAILFCLPVALLLWAVRRLKARAST
jgi:hypothetical protein